MRTSFLLMLFLTQVSFGQFDELAININGRNLDNFDFSGDFLMLSTNARWYSAFRARLINTSIFQINHGQRRYASTFLLFARFVN